MRTTPISARPSLETWPVHPGWAWCSMRPLWQTLVIALARWKDRKKRTDLASILWTVVFSRLKSQKKVIWLSLVNLIKIQNTKMWIPLSQFERWQSCIEHVGSSAFRWSSGAEHWESAEEHAGAMVKKTVATCCNCFSCGCLHATNGTSSPKQSQAAWDKVYFDCSEPYRTTAPRHRPVVPEKLLQLNVGWCWNSCAYICHRLWSFVTYQSYQSYQSHPWILLFRSGKD